MSQVVSGAVLNSAPFPVPLGTPSHLAPLFGNIYSHFSRDPLASPALAWSIPTQGIANLVVQGATATLYVQRTDTQAISTMQFNLAVRADGLTRPLLSDLQNWLQTTLATFFSGLSAPSVAPAVVNNAHVNTGISALAVPEGFYSAPTMIPRATSLNYCTVRVIALLFDLMQADLSNFFATMTISGAQGFWLDWLGSFYGVPRLQNTSAYGQTGSSESDDDYRRRISRALVQPYNNNVAIAQLLQQQLDISQAQVMDYKSPTQTGLFTITLSQTPSLATSQMVALISRLRAPGTTLAAIQVQTASNAFVLANTGSEEASSASGTPPTTTSTALPTTGTNASSSHASSVTNLGTKTLNGVTRLYTGSGVVF